MRHKWPLAAVTAVVLLTAACGKGGTSAAQGKEHATEARKTTAEVYWKLYHALSAPAFTSGASGTLTRCSDKGSKYARYVVRTIVGGEGKGVTSASLTQTVAGQLSSVGWRLSPASGPERSATKGGISVVMQPPSFGAEPGTALEVRGACVDLGSAADALFDDYATQSDLYSSSDASKSPIPTTFPSPMG